MPYKSEKIKLPREYDRRIRFTEEKKAKASLLYSQGVSLRGIARELGINRRAIQFFLFPDRLKRNIELRKERGGSKIYYDREKNTKAIKNLRHYKQELYLKGILKNDRL